MATVIVNVAVVPLKFGFVDVDVRSMMHVPPDLNVIVVPTTPEQTALLEGSNFAVTDTVGLVVVNAGTRYTVPYVALASRFPESVTPPTLMVLV